MILAHHSAPTAYSAKGACYFCNLADDKDGYFGTQIDVFREGEILVCTRCCRDFGTAVGLEETGSMVRLRQQVKDLKETIATLKPQADAYKVFIEKLEEARVVA